MAKKFDIKNVSMVFLPFVPAHIEYFKSGKHYLGKMKDGEWYIFWYFNDGHDEYLQTIDDMTYFSLDELEYWGQLPKLEK